MKWVYDASHPHYIAQIPQDAIQTLNEHNHHLVLTKRVTRVKSETEERQERSGPFKKKIVQRWAPVKTIDNERWDIVGGNPQPVELLEGRPLTGDADNKSVWLAIEPTVRLVNGVAQEVYLVRPVKSWLELRKPTIGKEQDADEVERSMKVARALETQERKRFEKFIGTKTEDDGVDTKKRKRDDDTKTKKSKRSHDAPDSAGTMGALREGDDVWEGDEAFSDDDDLLADDEEQQKEERGLDVDADDAEKSREVREEGDEDDNANRDRFAMDIQRILQEEHEKEKLGKDESALDAELEQIQSSDEDDEEEDLSSSGTTTPAKSAPSIPTPQFALRPNAPKKQLSKEEEMRAAIKDLFWRREFVLKVSDVLELFPKIKKGSDDYITLFKALKELADVKDGLLYLKMNFRR